MAAAVVVIETVVEAEAETVAVAEAETVVEVEVEVETEVAAREQSASPVEPCSVVPELLEQPSPWHIVLLSTPL